MKYLICFICFILLICFIYKNITLKGGIGKRDTNFDYRYQIETYNKVLEKSQFERKIIPKNNRWLKFVDCAYVVGLGKNWINFKKQALSQDLENITHYYTAPLFEDIKQKFYKIKDKNMNKCLGCHFSHVLCCEDALKNNYKSIIIMEDDCFFTKYISENEINKLVELKNKYKPKYINLSPHPNTTNKFCNKSKLDLIKAPSSMTHFIYVNEEGMKHMVRTKYEQPPKPFRLASSQGFLIDRDWAAGGDNFWYSFSNEYVLSVPEKEYWAKQHVENDLSRNK